MLGVSYLRDLSRRTLFVSLPLLVAGTWLGWRFIDQPKLSGWHREISPALILVDIVFVVGAIIVTRRTRPRQ